jgi:hypothetical protein
LSCVTFKRHEHLLIFKLCAKCDKLYLNIIDHLLVSCDRTRDKRDDFWQDIINIDPDRTRDKRDDFWQDIINIDPDRTRDKRDDFWQDIINIDPIDFSVYMDSLSSTDFICTVISCDTTYELDQDELLFFSNICMHYVASTCRQFESLLTLDLVCQFLYKFFFFFFSLLVSWH